LNDRIVTIEQYNILEMAWRGRGNPGFAHGLTETRDGPGLAKGGKSMAIPLDHLASGGMAPPSRRLTDKILMAFHHACDQGEFEIATKLLRILETILKRRPTISGQTERRSRETFVAAHERLWRLRHPYDRYFEFEHHAAMHPSQPERAAV
jgi:hypothetical protein